MCIKGVKSHYNVLIIGSLLLAVVVLSYLYINTSSKQRVYDQIQALDDVLESGYNFSRAYCVLLMTIAEDSPADYKYKFEALKLMIEDMPPEWIFRVSIRNKMLAQKDDLQYWVFPSLRKDDSVKNIVFEVFNEIRKSSYQNMLLNKGNKSNK